jgi:hypothetical protein
MRKAKPSFNDIVAEVKAAPKPDVPVKQEPGEVLIAPDGTVFRNADQVLDVDEAIRLLSTGAWIAIDECGCGGYCTPEWHSPTAPIGRTPEVRKTKKHQEPFASIEKWISDDGSSMVFFSGPDFTWV